MTDVRQRPTYLISSPTNGFFSCVGAMTGGDFGFGIILIVDPALFPGRTVNIKKTKPSEF